MLVKELRLQNFRNYEDQLLSAVAGDNLLVGRNAQGKTNILEAIYLLTCARSHRTGKDPELIRHGSDYYRLELNFSGAAGEDQNLVIFYQDLDRSIDRALYQNLSAGRRKRREIYYQGAKLEKISELFGLFQAVIFAPEDLQLIKGAPGERRRFLDLILAKVSKTYFTNLQDFQRILSERNQILKKMREKPGDLQQIQLDLWTERLAVAGAKVMHERLIQIEALKEFAEEALKTLSDEKENLSLSYESFANFTAEDSLEQLSAAYENRLKKSEFDDIQRGSSSYGPQRDDLRIELNGLVAKTYASQGQQRSLALALRIAELHLIHQLTGEKPVLLLDDVMSELDPGRRTRLFQAISSEQVFLTCADVDQVLPAFASAQGSISQNGAALTQMFKISAGTIEETVV
ncbi:MAG: DNA replication/repair protein RecF [Eubacteriales bacterium]|nr:DNA replication/repair protein RecF [Eubacteriales bacterium]